VRERERKIDRGRERERDEEREREGNSDRVECADSQRGPPSFPGWGAAPTPDTTPSGRAREREREGEGAYVREIECV
jgi:hypothetical protein